MRSTSKYENLRLEKDGDYYKAFGVMKIFTKTRTEIDEK